MELAPESVIIEKVEPEKEEGGEGADGEPADGEGTDGEGTDGGESADGGEEGVQTYKITLKKEIQTLLDIDEEFKIVATLKWFKDVLEKETEAE